ncbi:hypothetical protein L1987_02620 [Smallanthus sonchifolius]|uniref:Uncharacterized protein n=1 Tax=Smallanthus sonchifolius TaxID=185202 RepID=A0ACB9K8I0_9ASTR|nr:hypothetical protein L1987_02620 [Smallanthus sonchifolius]
MFQDQQITETLNKVHVLREVAEKAGATADVQRLLSLLEMLKVGLKGGNEPLALDMSGMGNSQIINGQSIGGIISFYDSEGKTRVSRWRKWWKINEFPTTHEEIHPTGILSVVGNLTPSSDHNQSPRNIYQCQMAKHTMGFSSQGINCRADQKLDHLQTLKPQLCALLLTKNIGLMTHHKGQMQLWQCWRIQGKYDMKDAMVLNKSSVDRGFAHGHIYQYQ